MQIRSLISKSSDFGTVLETARFAQNKGLTTAVSRGFSEREQPVFLSLRRRVGGLAPGDEPNAINDG